MEQNDIFHNRYKLKRMLGRGQFSEVWLAEDTSTSIEVALKIFAPGTGMDEDGAQMLSREFALVFNAIHENLLRPIHYDICDHRPYLVLPFCKEGSCSKLVGKMNEEDAWKFIHDVAAGLAFLHDYKPDPIIHQDIKPDNLMIGPTGNYMITDFGVSTHSRSALRKSVGANFSSAGTVAYMGPERFSRDKTPIKASDIYSLGATVFELITGMTPFEEHGGLLQAQGAEIPDIKGDFSPELRYTIRSCMHFNPWDRPSAETLVKWATTRKPDMPGGGKKEDKKPSWLLPSIIGGAIVIVAIVLTLVLGKGDSGVSGSEANYPLYTEYVVQCEKLINSGEIDKAQRTLSLVKSMDNQYGPTDDRYNNYEKLAQLMNKSNNGSSAKNNKE